MTHTTPCAICLHNGDTGRGPDWPTTMVGGVTVHRLCAGDARSALALREGATVGADDVVRWDSNGRCVPDDVMRRARDLYAIVTAQQTEATAQARRRETDELLAAYRRAQAGRPVSDEQRAQARAAFGPGVAVVDAISGRAYRT